MVGNDAFYVTRLCSAAPGHNVYGIEEANAVLSCPNPACGHSENAAGRATCEVCGIALDGVVALRRRFQLHEYQEFEDVAVAAHLAEQQLRHTSLISQTYFSERPYGSRDRHYLILPDPMPVTADHLPVPQKLVRALSWGVQLAEGLAFLHRHRIGWQKVTPEQIAVQDRSAAWCHYTTAVRLAEDEAEATRQQDNDIVGLVGLIHHLATGQDDFSPDTGMPPAVSSIFERVLCTRPLGLSAAQLAHELRAAVDAIRRPSTVTTLIGQCTDVGMVRDLNEDSLLSLRMDRVRCSLGEAIGLVAVADGMGGHAAGDVASGLAINVLATRMVNLFLAPYLAANEGTSDLRPEEWLERAVQAANTEIFVRRQDLRCNMGTTLVAAVVIADTAYIANVGDSRAYLINADGIRQITTDHSLVGRLVAMGHITQEEARVHPQRNVIYRTLGDEPEVEVDSYALCLQPGDRLLLCSDGLSSIVEDPEIWSAVIHNTSPQDACERLVQQANHRGGQDNISVVVVQAQQA